MGAARTRQGNVKDAVVRVIGAAPAVVIRQIPTHIEESVRGASRDSFQALARRGLQFEPKGAVGLRQPRAELRAQFRIKGGRLRSELAEVGHRKRRCRAKQLLLVFSRILETQSRQQRMFAGSLIDDRTSAVCFSSASKRSISAAEAGLLAHGQLDLCVEPADRRQGGGSA